MGMHTAPHAGGLQSSQPSWWYHWWPVALLPAWWNSLLLTTHLTWQPNVLKRKRTHGFLKRCALA